MRLLLSMSMLAAAAIGGSSFAQDVKPADTTQAAAPAQAAKSRMTIPRSLICTGIVNREPQGEATKFAKDVGKVSCFTQIKGGGEESQIQHKWYHKGSLVSTITLSVPAATWRTNSSRPILASQLGAWKVEIVDVATGEALKTLEFTVE